jgi:hypothetical protein
MAYIELHTHTSWQKNSQSLVSNDLHDCSCAPVLDATSSENGYLTTEELLCSTVSEERVCNSSACISHTVLYGPTQPSVDLHLVQEIWAERVHLQMPVLVGPLYVMQLWAMFRLASNAAHKNQCAKRIMSCSYHKILHKHLLMKL